MKFLNEDIFSAYLMGVREFSRIRKPLINLSCVKLRHFGFKVEDVYFRYECDDCWFRMKSKSLDPNTSELLHFTAKSKKSFDYSNKSYEIVFHVKVVSTIGNYYYQFMDTNWIRDLWMAATSEQLTDVEIFSGSTNKIMEAHRVILSSRSPVLKELLSRIRTTEKSVVTFSSHFDRDIVRRFLKFLYTGHLETYDGLKQLLALAIKYEVETLKNVCQLANRVPDAEEVANSLLALALG